MSQEVFGLAVGTVLTEDETPLEVLGVVKYLDGDGNVAHFMFGTSDLTPVEALGMAEFLAMRARDDMQTSIYMCEALEEDDDD